MGSETSRQEVSYIKAIYIGRRDEKRPKEPIVLMCPIGLGDGARQEPYLTLLEEIAIEQTKARAQGTA